MKTATIVLPSGYATAEEFAKDCGFELPAVPALGTPVAWQCIDERREFRYIKGIVSVDKETVEAWKDVGIAFVGLGRIDVPAQGKPASLPLCCVTGLIAGDKDACGDCDPCGASCAVPEPVKELMRARDEWANKYSEAMGELDELRHPEVLAERAAATVCHDCGTDDPCGENCPNWIATKTEVALVTCPKCGGSGFSGRGSGYDDVCDECGGCKEVPASWRSPAANAEQRRAEVCAAVAHVLHGRNRQCDYPIYETQDDRGLDEAEYIDFAMDVLASLRSRSQPVTASQREIAINLLGWPSPEKAAEALLSKFNVTCKTTEEPRG